MSSTSSVLRFRLSERIKTLPKRSLRKQLTETQKQPGWQPETSPYKKPSVLSLALPRLPEKLIYCPQLTDISRKRFHDYLISDSCPWIIERNAVEIIDDILKYSDLPMRTQKLSSEADVRPVFVCAYGMVLAHIFRVMNLPEFSYESAIPIFKDPQDGSSNGIITDCQFTIGGAPRMAAEEKAWMVAEHYLARIVEAARSMQPVVMDRETTDEASIISKARPLIIRFGLQFLFLKKIMLGNTTYFAVSDIHHSERDPIIETLTSLLVEIPDEFQGKSFDDLIAEAILSSDAAGLNL
ncbi:hypothetical protein BT69DRAFT_1349544 [Atractiella rhizophila]|nr:hypothetical protein BT69DRAFT_1349544 [Atractiella rhizophila]